jgi:putative membrane protein insertion efficiency factor
MSKLIIFINIYLIKIYQYLLSPIFVNKCRYLPTCSEYYIEALRTYGFIKGSYFGFKRIFSCHPYKFLGGGSGLDYVVNKKDLNKRKNNG